MKEKLFTLMFITVILAGLLIFTGCKTSTELQQFTLTVTLSEGVTGTPAAGTYTYTEKDVLSYNYSAQTGYGNLTATLDNTPIPASGTITITGNHALNVNSDINIRNKWTGHFYHTVYDNDMEVTFSGGIVSGTTQGKIENYGNGSGNFTITNGQIEFTLLLPQLDLIFKGTINDVNQMEGTWEIANNGGSSASSLIKLPSTGNWELER